MHNRIERAPEDANPEIGSFCSDTLVVCGREMLTARIAGDQNADWMSDYAHGRLRNNCGESREAGFVYRVSRMRRTCQPAV